MSRSTYELIGEIIHPQPRALPDPHPAIAALPRVPVSALIGWTIGPPGRGVEPPANAAPAAEPRTAPVSPARSEPLPLPPV